MDSKEKPSPDQAPRDRRSFLNFLWMALAGAGLVEGIAVVMAFVRSGKTAAAGQGPSIRRMRVGAVDDFKAGSVTPYPQGKFYLVRLADGGFLALSRQCTHLGCTVPWVAAENQFVCPCHASAFDIAGSVISPPAPRALDIYAVTIENEMVIVDTGTPIKRSAFNAEQVTYPKKRA